MCRMSEKITAIVKKEHFSGLTSGVWLVKLHGSKNLKNTHCFAFVWKEQYFSYPQGYSAWSKNQVDMRQIGKKKNSQI